MNNFLLPFLCGVDDLVYYKKTMQKIIYVRLSHNQTINQSKIANNNTLSATTIGHCIINILVNSAVIIT